MKKRKILVCFLIIIAIGMYIGICATYFHITKNVDLDESKLPKNTAEIQIVSATGDLINESNYVKLSEMPTYVPQAFIAMEDKRFYTHIGIDPIRILGAAIANIKAKEYTQGGSTISCQLIKNTHLNNDKTIVRKVQEAKLALQIESRYTKQEIMEMYLNVLYFGKGIYGIGTAARVIFGKNIKDITLSETASLVATIVAPSIYSPIIDAEKNARRREVVLSEMAKCGYISEETLADVKSKEITINYNNFRNNYNEELSKIILKEADEILTLKRITGTGRPITIDSFIDTNVQNVAKATVCSEEADSIEKTILISDNVTGGIIAYVGTDHTFTSPHQQGSTLKPFVYAAAIEKGMLTTQTQLYDVRRSFNGYSPANYNDTYYGWMSAQSALARSSNTIAVKVLNDTGIDVCYSYMQKCGLKLTDKDKSLALALGGTTYGSTAVELTVAYMTLANQGVKTELSFVKRIRDADGNTLYEHRPNKECVVSPSSTYIVTEMLKETVRNGTASQLSYLDVPVAAKTGTVARANGNSDAWTLGYTSSHTFLCRYSAKGGENMPNSVTGGNLPAKSIRNVLSYLYKDIKPHDFYRPAGVRYADINSDIKEAFHVLVPASEFEVGKKEKIPIIAGFSFDSLDKGDFYLKNLSFSTIGKDVRIKFDRVPEVTYNVYADACPCKEEDGGYVTHRKTNAFVKVDIVCKHKGITLFQKSKLIIPY